MENSFLSKVIPQFFFLALDEEDLNHLMKYIEAGTESRMEK